MVHILDTCLFYVHQKYTAQKNYGLWSSGMECHMVW